MDWVTILLRVFKKLAIISFIIFFIGMWLKVPDEKLNELEVKYAPKQSK